MTNGDDLARRIAAVEVELPAPLPDAYRSWLARASGGEGWLGPWDATWERTVRGFLREWHPLRARVVPVEHLGDGVFACLHLAGSQREARVIAWDIALDLAEQPMAVLAEHWPSYRDGRRRGLDLLGDFGAVSEACRAAAARQLDQQVAAFEQSVGAFHDGYSDKHQGQAFEHHAENAIPRRSDWRPERFAVQDILLGVMTYRYNPGANYVDVVGFATRDHTNFARGSATASLLVGLLCEWALHDAAGIRFLRAVPPGDRANGEPAAVPREVAVLAALLDVEVSPDDAEIPAAACRGLLRELTPFPPGVRRHTEAVGAGIERICLAVHRGLWNPMEAALLLASCPDAVALFTGGLDAGEHVRILTALPHARAALLAGFGVRAIETEAARLEAAASPVELLPYPYAVLSRPAVPMEWRRPTGTDVLRVQARDPIAMVGLGTLDQIAEDRLEPFLAGVKSAIEPMLPPGCLLLGVVPDRAGMRSGVLELIQADLDAAALDASIQKRLERTRRLRA